MEDNAAGGQCMSPANPSLPPLLLRPGEGDVLDFQDGDVSIVLAAGAATGGAFSIVEHRLAPGADGPPLHYHQRMCDAFYVLTGTLTIRTGEGTEDLPAGSFACFPPGTVHTFANPSAEPVRVLNVNAPGGWDQVLRAIARAAEAAGPRASAAVGEIAAERDMVLVER